MSVPAEAIRLPPADAGTLQERIRQAVTAGILSGRFRPGERMPSTRGLARHLGVSRITVTLAYAELVASDYLAARGRSGFHVSVTAPRPPPGGPAAAPARVAVDYARIAGTRAPAPEAPERPADWARYPYPFIYGQADPTLFDHANWRACALKALGSRDFPALARDSYADDDPMLVDALCRMILPRRGIEAHPGEVLVTMGAQQALWIAVTLLVAPGRPVAMENPGYPALRALLAAAGAAVHPVAVDAEGLPPAALPAVAAVFTTASHQSPTGATMPLARRQALLARAAAGDMVIVEDDYEFEMPFRARLVPSLKSLDRDGRVIHIGSFSKSLFPGLRLGFLVAPEPFVALARRLRAAVMRHPPGHLQRTVAHFLTLGHYDALVNRMAAAYRQRRAAMAEAIAACGLTVAGAAEGGGSSFWMRARGDAGALAHRLRADGVLIEPGQVFFAPGSGGAGHYYRLAYSSIPAARIAEGIALIAGAEAG